MIYHFLALILLFTLFLTSGTEKQHVADDYAKRLHIGQVECQVHGESKIRKLRQIARV